MIQLDDKNRKRFLRILEQYKLYITAQMKLNRPHTVRSNNPKYAGTYNSPKWDTGSTVDSLTPVVELKGDTLTCKLETDKPIQVAVQETGRKPGPTPSNFAQIIYEWSIRKGIKFQNDKDRWSFAWAVKFKTQNEGSVQFTEGAITDIYTDVHKKYQTQIEKGVVALFNDEVKTEIKTLLRNLDK